MFALLVAVALAFGFVARRLGLPPLVGFLIAGFVLGAADVGEKTPTVAAFADLGVTLLLFSIGLKLKIGTLFRPEIWAGTTLHMASTILVLALVLFSLGSAGLIPQLEVSSALIVAFALSFSSTVFAVKVLEERGEMAAPHAVVAIGILIMQDLVAVLFMTATRAPSIWALALLGIPLLRPLLFRIMDRCGHGELLLLYGLVVALFAGAEGFNLVGMKADLGALVLGVVVSTHPKADELANSLLSVKDLFLVGFFLNIGLTQELSAQALILGALLMVAVPLKTAGFVALLLRFRLRARTAALSGFTLANYSEFGLIVSTVAAGEGWIGGEWLVTIAVAASLSFVAASPLNARAHALFARFSTRIQRFERTGEHPDGEPLDPGNAQVVIFGMGRIGTGTYDALHARLGDIVLGIDVDAKTVQAHRDAGRRVLAGDATDPEFWERVRPTGQVRLTLLAVPQHAANLAALERMSATEYRGRIAAVAQFDDEVEELLAAGADVAYNFFTEAGSGFAEHVYAQFEQAED